MKEILKTAFKEAQIAFEQDEVPVGAVLFHSETKQIIAAHHNQTEQQKNPLAHAEILVIREASKKLGLKRLPGYSVFVTLEPCAMCAGALSLARVDAVYFGAFDPKSGAVCQGCQTFEHPQTHHKPFCQGGFEEKKCADLLKKFFKQKREKNAAN